MNCSLREMRPSFERRWTVGAPERSYLSDQAQLESRQDTLNLNKRPRSSSTRRANPQRRQLGHHRPLRQAAGLESRYNATQLAGERIGYGFAPQNIALEVCAITPP